jgi:DNA-directed RNA polymerase
MHSKVKINLQTTVKDKFDKEKQKRALMPNLIHSLDASSMSMLHKYFLAFYNDKTQLYSVHDCFGTTCDKVFLFKTMLASVYTDIYSSDQYLVKFDKYILDYIENTTNFVIDRDKIIFIDNVEYKIHDVQ